MTRALLQSQTADASVEQLSQAGISKEVIDYCARHGFLDCLREAIRLVVEVYQPVGPIEGHLQDDPDVDETYVIIDVSIECDITEALRRESDFTRRWIETSPTDARDRLRVLYDLI